MSSRAAWLRLWFVWAVPALIVIANALWLFGLRSAVLGRGSLLVRQKAELEADVAALSGKRDALASAQGALTSLQSDLGSLRRVQLGSMRERLVSFLVDVAKRTHAAGLVPERISYAASADAKSGMVHFLATFNLSGTYEQIRRCVNLLEGSPQFVVVERLGLRSDEGATSLAIEVQLAVGTYFVDADTGMLRELGIEDAPRTAAASPSAEESREASPRGAAPPIGTGEFAAVDAQVLQDLREAVSGLAADEQLDEDIFVAPEPEPSARSGRNRGRSSSRPRGTADSFMSQVGRREVSGGR